MAIQQEEDNSNSIFTAKVPIGGSKSQLSSKELFADEEMEVAVEEKVNSEEEKEEEEEKGSTTNDRKSDDVIKNGDDNTLIRKLFVKLFASRKYRHPFQDLRESDFDEATTFEEMMNILDDNDNDDDGDTFDPDVNHYQSNNNSNSPDRFSIRSNGSAGGATTRSWSHRPSVSGFLHGQNALPQDDIENCIQMDHDMYSILMIADCNKVRRLTPTLLALLVFALQVSVYMLILINIFDLSDGWYNPFQMPADVDMSTRMAQLIAIVLTVLTQEDLRKAIGLVRDGHKHCRFVTKNNMKVKRSSWLLSITTRALQGMIGPFTTFFLIMQSTDVVDLMLNFSAIEFVSMVDNLTFSLALEGAFGRQNKLYAEEIAVAYYSKKNSHSHYRNTTAENCDDNHVDNDDVINTDSTFNTTAVKKLTAPRRKSLSFRASEYCDSSLCYFYVALMPLLMGWFFIFLSQKHGSYSCMSVYVQLDDSVLRELGYLSGLYRFQNKQSSLDISADIAYVLDIDNDDDGKVGTAQFQYCDQDSAWVFTYTDPRENTTMTGDPCDNDNWVLRSSETDARFDMSEIPPTLDWYVKENDGNREISVNGMKIICLDCLKNENVCGLHGECEYTDNDNKNNNNKFSTSTPCKCEDGWHGLLCGFHKPCSNIEVDPLFDEFIGTRPYGMGFELLAASSSAATATAPKKDSGDNKFEGEGGKDGNEGEEDIVQEKDTDRENDQKSQDDGKDNDDKTNRALLENDFEFMEMHHRPVYINETGISPNDFNIIMFTGRRWILTISNSFPVLEDKKHTLDDIITYLKEDFHTFWSEYTILFVSEPVKIDTPTDLLSTPEGIQWYSMGNSEIADDNGKDKKDTVVANTVFLCAECTDENGLNPCQSGGSCVESNNRCDCSSTRASGAMCQLKPIGDGYCDPYFNEKLYQNDGGDCCKATCLSGENECGFLTNDNGRSIYAGYPGCVNKKHSTCKDKQSVCWNEVSDVISSEGIRNAESGHSISLSANGRTLAIGEPGIDRVRVFSADGMQWVQLGESLYGQQSGSRFGESVFLSDDGATLVVGASKFVTSSFITANDNAVDTNTKRGVYQGQVSIYKLHKNEWNLAEESPTDETIHSNISKGRLGAKLAMSTDAKIMYLAFPFSGTYGGVVVLMKRKSSDNDQEGTFFGNHNDEGVRRSFYISQNMNVVEDTKQQTLRNLGRSLSISSSGHMAAFGGRAIQNQTDYVIVYKYMDSNATFSPVGSIIQGCCGILSGDGSILVVVSTKNAKGEEIVMDTEGVFSSFSQVYRWDNQNKDWSKQGSLIEGAASSLSFDGSSITLLTSDDKIYNYIWNNNLQQQQWEYRADVRFKEFVRDGSTVLQSTEKSGTDSFMVVGIPFGEGGGYTKIYGLLETETDSDESNSSDKDSKKENTSDENADKDADEDAEEFDINIDNRESLVRIEITTDANPDEILWEIRNPATQQILASGGPYDTKMYEHTMLVETAKIPIDIECKEFVIYDTGGNGLCCDHGLGSYSLFVAGEMIQSGREYHWSDGRIQFGVCEENSEHELKCESDETLFNIRLVTDNYPTETSWMLTNDISGEIIIHQNDFTEPQTEYDVKICLPPNSCTNFAIMDSGSDGLCCEEGFGNYIVTLDGDTLKKGSEFSDSETISFGSSCSTKQITATKSDDCADNYSKLQVKIKTDGFPWETRWFIHFFPINNNSTADNILLSEGGPYEEKDVSYIEEICIPDDYCTVFEIYDSGNNGFDPRPGSGSGYSLSMKGGIIHSVVGRDFISYDFYAIGGNTGLDCRRNFVTSFHLVQNQKQDQGKTSAIPITCSDEIQNYCEAPTSCVKPKFQPIGKYFGAIALEDNNDVRWSTTGGAGGGTWITKGAYSLSFGNERGCNAKCVGGCYSSCSNDDLIFRLQIYNSSPPPDTDESYIVFNDTAAFSSWKLFDYDDNNVVLAEGSKNKYEPNGDKEASVLVQVGRTCIPSKVCTVLTINSLSNGDDRYVLHINGEMIQSGSINSQEIVYLGTGCPLKGNIYSNRLSTGGT